MSFPIIIGYSLPGCDIWMVVILPDFTAVEPFRMIRPLPNVISIRTPKVTAD